MEEQIQTLRQELAMFQLNQMKKNDELEKMFKTLSENVDYGFGESKGSWNEIWAFVNNLNKVLGELKEHLTEATPEPIKHKFSIWDLFK